MRRLSSYADRGTERQRSGCCFCGHFLEDCGEVNRAAAHTTSSMCRRRSHKDSMGTAVVPDIASFKTARSMPRKTLRLVVTTSSSCSYRNPLRPTSDKTGRRSAPSTGTRRTNAAPSFEEVSVLGSATLQRKREDGFGGRGGGAGSARGASQGARAMLRRADTVTDTVTAIACRILARGRGGRVYYRRNEGETEATREAPLVPLHQRPTSMTASDPWRAGSDDGATAPPARPAPLHHGRTHCARRRLLKEVLRRRGGHSCRLARDRARARAIYRGKARGLACSVTLSP